MDATGVQRQSLYDTFGSKHEMFLQSLLPYQALEGHQLSDLTKAHPKGGLSLIRAIFESCASQTVCDARGCFAANCAAELGSSDEAVAERVRIGRDGLEAVFERCLEQARDVRQLKNSSSVSALAQFLVNANYAYTYFRQSVVICRPYLNDQDTRLLESRFAALRTRDEYLAITAEIQKVSAEHHLSLPKFDPW